MISSISPLVVSFVTVIVVFLCSQSLNEMQRRHVGGNPHGAGASLVGRGEHVLCFPANCGCTLVSVDQHR